MRNDWLIKGTLASGKSHNARIKACVESKIIDNEAEYNIDVFKKACIDSFEVIDDSKRILYIPVSENMDYTNLIDSVVLESVNGTIHYNNIEQDFIKLCSYASNESQQFSVILDDIDRVDIVKTFGELLYAIENRGEMVTLQSGRSICVPDNVSIILTMDLTMPHHVPDYAFLRRFNTMELFSDRSVIEQSINDGETVSEALEKYDFFNNILRKNISNDECVNNYLLGHAWFIANSKFELDSKVCYQVWPLLQEYQKMGIIDIENTELAAIKKSIQVDIASYEPIHEIKRIDIINGKRVENKRTFEEILVNLARATQKPDIVRFLFELTWKSQLLDAHTLMAKLYLNTQIMEVHNKYNENIKGAFLIRDELADYGFVYNDNNSHNQAPSNYYTKGKSENNYPVYNYNGQDYRLMTGVRDAAATVKIYEKQIVGSRVDNTSVTAKAIVPVLSSFIYNYYLLYREGLLKAIVENGKDSNLLNLFKLVERDILWLESKDGKTSKKFYEEILDINKLCLLSKKRGDIINANINGKNVDITVIGVKTMESGKYKEIMDELGVKQIILQGPPGTSKTYGAKEYLINQIKSLLDGKYDDKFGEGKVWGNKEQLAPETCFGKDFLGYFQINSKEYDWNISDIEHKADKELYWDIVQFHPSYGYEDFIRGITVGTKGKGDESQMYYETVNKVLGKICRFANAVSVKNTPVYLIIDEINRANVAAVFGELIYALENRGDSVNTPYKVEGEGNKIVIPNNLYIIGTMNTADKSIGNIDYAVRRRFLFFPMLPNKQVVNRYVAGSSDRELILNLYDSVEKVFDDNISEDFNKEDVQVGHTMFLAKDKKEMYYRFKYQILPILREYYRDGVLIKTGTDINSIMSYLEVYGHKSQISDESLWTELTGDTEEK